MNIQNQIIALSIYRNSNTLPISEVEISEVEINKVKGKFKFKVALWCHNHGVLASRLVRWILDIRTDNLASNIQRYLKNQPSANQFAFLHAIKKLVEKDWCISETRGCKIYRLFQERFTTSLALFDALTCLGLKKFDPNKTYPNQTVYGEDGDEIPFKDIPSEFLFETSKGYVVDIRLIIYRLEFKETYIPHPGGDKEVFCKNPVEFNALISIAKSLESSAPQLLKKLEELRNQLLIEKRHLTTLPTRNVLLEDPTANISMAHFNSLRKYLRPDQLEGFFNGALKENTINQLSYLAGQLRFWGIGGSADENKLITMHEFNIFLSDLEKNDSLEYVRLLSLPLQKLFPLANWGVDKSMNYISSHPYIFGLLFNDTIQGRVCINDLFIPNMNVLFGLMHLVDVNASSDAIATLL